MKLKRRAEQARKLSAAGLDRSEADRTVKMRLADAKQN
jgi:hypothetical protein